MKEKVRLEWRSWILANYGEAAAADFSEEGVSAKVEQLLRNDPDLKKIMCSLKHMKYFGTRGPRRTR